MAPIEQCYEGRTEDADAAIDAVQLARYQDGSAAQRAATLADDSAWISARQPVCAKAFHTRSTIDEINVAGCVLAESTPRLDAVKGFLVNPGQFSYVDGSFTDQGKVQAPAPSGHQVSPGAQYQFSIDYSRLSADPGASKGKGGWVYAPASPVAAWR